MYAGGVGEGFFFRVTFNHLDRLTVLVPAFKTAVQFWLDVTTAILNPRWRS